MLRFLPGLLRFAQTNCSWVSEDAFTNHRTENFITPPDTHLRAFCTTPDTICAPTLVKSRFFLCILYIYCICALTTMMPPQGLCAKTLRGQLLSCVFKKAGNVHILITFYRERILRSHNGYSYGIESRV